MEETITMACIMDCPMITVHAGPVIIEQMAYFITDENSTKGRDPSINIINGILKIKGKTPVNILVSNYTNKHITFNKREYIGHLEPAIMDGATIDDSECHPTHSITLQKMMVEQVQPDIFDPPHHKLKPGIQSKLDTLLQEYETQFAKDETSIRTMPLTEMTINTGDSEPISQKPYHIAMKNYQWVKEEIEKTTHSKGYSQQQIQLVSTNICSPKRRWRKMISHQLQSIKQGY